MKLLLMGGTTEGRYLAQALDGPRFARFQVTLSVATEYGQEVLPEFRRVQVRRGRLEEEGLKALLCDGYRLVIDATHPYAKEVSETLARVCQALGLPLWRCLRPESPLPAGVLTAPDAAGAARLLQDLPGNILLTTGSKELGAFACLDRSRLFARVLPTVEGIRACEALGLAHGHILALQGPFGRELNEALLRAYGISVLVTKDGGSPGGLEEKLAAARNLRVQVVLIRRPLAETGLSPQEILTRLEAWRCEST